MPSSLYHSLLVQHSRALTPVRCAEQTISQLHRYFEDVVIENNLSALAVESFHLVRRRPAREHARLREIARTARSSFLLFAADDDLKQSFGVRTTELDPVPLVLPLEYRENGRFVVIADARFSALLASPPRKFTDEGRSKASEVVWTFDPDVVYSALEYLMARVAVEFPDHEREFSAAVRRSMPKATSLQLTVSVTTKLARLLQSQAEREIAINRIATAMRDSQKLNDILQVAANEVGRALGGSSCGVRVEVGSPAKRMTSCYFRPDMELGDNERAALLKDFESLRERLAEEPAFILDDNDCEEELSVTRLGVPLNHGGGVVGMLLVRSDDATRTWAENELLLMQTVADQITVAINQAHLFAQLQQQALTDALTRTYNRRAFEMQLERDLSLAARKRQPLSLIMMDLDYLKPINDRYGHESGDNALCLVADALRAKLRAVHTAARFGGDEFAVILPQADSDAAMRIAEKLRAKIAAIEMPGVGSLSASFGVASYPLHGPARESLVGAADRALYQAKRMGRNRVCLAEDMISDDDLIESQNPNLRTVVDEPVQVLVG